MEPLLALLLIVVCAYGVGELCKKIRIPRVVGQISVGVIFGMPFLREYFLGGINADVLKFLADLGILLLFFFVGLQINIADFKKHVGESLLVSLFNTLLPFVVGVALFHFLGYDLITCIIIGICLSVSAQTVSLDVLEELGKIKTAIGRLVITAGAIDDILEMVLISIVLALIHASVGQSPLGKIFIEIGLFVVVMVLFRLVLLPILLKFFAKEHSATYLFTGAIIVTLMMAIITSYLGMEAVIGALFAGIMVREVLMTGRDKNPWEEHNIAFAIHMVSFGFFVPIFFVWVGLNTSIAQIFTNWQIVVAMIIIAIFGTVLGTIIGVKLHKRGTLKEGWIVGWGVCPKGDVELVIATVALTQGLITQSVFSALIMMAFFTTLIPPFIFRQLVKKHQHRPA